VELVDDHEVVDVTGVEDGVDPRERIEDLRPELRARFRDVGIGNETDAQRVFLAEGADDRVHDAVPPV
jgi:hypothetical protein